MTWTVKLCHFSVVQDDDSGKIDISRLQSILVFLPVIVQDGVETMGNGENCRVGELLTDGLLDEGVGGDVNSSGGFVQDQDTSLAEKGTGKADQLALSDTAMFFSQLFNTLLFYLMLSPPSVIM